eukprot:1818780-Rhodomonas_salina.4
MSHDWHLDKLLGAGANGEAYLAFRKDYKHEPVMDEKFVIKKVAFPLSIHLHIRYGSSGADTGCQVFIGEDAMLEKSSKLRETQVSASPARAMQCLVLTFVLVVPALGHDPPPIHRHRDPPTLRRFFLSSLLGFLHGSPPGSPISFLSPHLPAPLPLPIFFSVRPSTFQSAEPLCPTSLCTCASHSISPTVSCRAVRRQLRGGGVSVRGDGVRGGRDDGKVYRARYELYCSDVCLHDCDRVSGIHDVPICYEAVTGCPGPNGKDFVKLPLHAAKGLFVQTTIGVGLVAAMCYAYPGTLASTDLPICCYQDGTVKIGDLGEGWLRTKEEIDPHNRWEGDPIEQVASYALPMPCPVPRYDTTHSLRHARAELGHDGPRVLLKSGTESARAMRFPAHPEIKHKKPHFQYQLYQECGFLYLSLQCTELAYGGPECWMGQCKDGSKADTWYAHPRVLVCTPECASMHTRVC